MNLLTKISTRRKRPHSIMFYHNRRKSLGLPSKKMTTMEYLKYKKAFRKAKRNYNHVKGYK